MKVQELIEALQKFDPDMNVALQDAYGDNEDVVLLPELYHLFSEDVVSHFIYQGGRGNVFHIQPRGDNNTRLNVPADLCVALQATAKYPGR